jgi:Domain of unknown function DUF29
VPDDLYHRDALAWAEQQAALLRRAARGEWVNDIDWDHVVEEIEDVGLSELSAVKSHLRQLLIHLLKLHGWPDTQTGEHWLNEAIQFQGEAESRFLPSMRQRIDIAPLHASALRIVTALQLDGMPPRALPVTCDLTVDDLLTIPPRNLLARLQG